MNGFRQSLGVRLAIAAVAALVGVVALHVAVHAGERPALTTRSRPAPGVSPLATLGFRLRKVTGVVLLASREAAVPPEVRPVLQVLADGGLVVRRLPPLLQQPGSRPSASAAIVVPAGPLSAWTPAARGMVVELLAELIATRPPAAEQVRVIDLTIGPQLHRGLLAWVP